MNDDGSAKPVATEDKLDAVLAECLRRIDAGDNVDLEAVCAAHPEVADGVRSYFAAQSVIQGKLQRPDEPPKEIVFATASIDTSRMAAQGDETIAPSNQKSPAAEPDGQQFGRYQLVRLLGEGAMGAVYLAMDTKLGRQVALKKPKISGPERAQILERFQREARAAAALSHANICPVYDVGEEDGTPYLTMGFIDGKPLNKLLGREDLTDRKIVQLIQVIASALQHAHEHGVVHRDLKLSNVLMNKTGQPFVTDFGLAFRLNQESDARLTQEGHMLGTPAYMAPEQVEGDLQKIGPSTDLYALGVMLYELLTGQLPFQGSVAAIMAQILRDKPKPLSQVAGRKIERELDDFCLTMLAKKPEQRPASMKVVADTLKKWLADNTPDALAKKQRQSQSLSRFEVDKQQIQQHITKGNFEHALVELQRLAALQDPEAAAVSSWARAELLRVRELKQKIQSGLPALLDTARKLLKSHDYTQVAQILEQVPAEYRSPELKQLLGKATDLQEESDLLLADLKDSLRRKAFKGLEQKVDDFLKLKPGNKFAKELREALNTYSKLPFKARKYDLDDRGQLLPLKDRGLWERWPLIALVGGGTFVAMLLAVVFYIQGRDGVIRVELNDPKLQVTFGDDHITFADNGREIRIAEAGKRKFSVTYGDVTVEGLPPEIAVKRNRQRVLKVSYVDGKVVLNDGQEAPLEARVAEIKVLPPILPNQDSYASLSSFLELDRSVKWTPLEITSFQSAGGASHRKLDDLSILVTGQTPKQDTYTVRAAVPAVLNRITAFKLEALTDGKSGPGRNDHGSFVVSHVQFRVGGGQPIPIGGALADFASSDDTSYTLIDRPANLPLPERAKREGGWMNLAWIPGNRVSRAVIMTPEQTPTATTGQTLQFVIEQQDSDWFTLERFRISVTGDPVDLAFDPTGANRKIADANPASVNLIGRGFRWDSLNLKEDKLPEEKFALVDVHFHAGAKVDDILNDLASLSRLRSLTISSRQDAELLIARTPFLDQIIIWNCPLTDSLGKEIGKRQELRNLHIWGSKQENPAVLIRHAPRTVRFMWLLDIRKPDAETWAALSELPRLRNLWINCDLDPTDLAQFAKLARIQELSLRANPNIKESHLEQFPTLAQLRTVYLPQGSFSEAAIKKLQQRMPYLEVITGENNTEKKYPPMKTPPVAAEATIVKELDDRLPLPVPTLPLFTKVNESVQWTPLDIASFKSTGGAAHEKIVADKSIRVVGKNPNQDTYTVTVVCPLDKVTAIKLEALPDGENGPGRFDNHQFVLSEFEMSVDGKGSAPFSSAIADYSQWPFMAETLAKRSAEASLTPKIPSQSGWAVDAPFLGNRVPRSALLALRNSQTGVSGKNLQFTLKHDSGWPQHNLGRFRLSATGDPLSSPFDPSGVNRRVAEWVLKNKGALQIVGAGFGSILDGEKAALPQEPFEIVEITLREPMTIEESLVKDVPNLDRLRALRINGDVAGSDRIIAAIKFMPFIQLEKSDIQPKTAVAIGGHLELWNFDVRSCFGTGLKEFPFDGLPHLTHLNIFMTPIPESAELRLAKCPTLTRLSAYSSGTSDSLFQARQQWPNLEELFLQSPGVTSAGIRKLAGSSQLKVLSLASTSVNDEILGTLSSYPSLETLILAGTKVTPKGFGNLVNCQRLKSLNLGSLKLTDADLEKIPTLTTLRTINLWFNQEVTVPGIQKLQQRMPYVEVITSENNKEKKYPPLKTPPILSERTNDEPGKTLDIQRPGVNFAAERAAAEWVLKQGHAIGIMNDQPKSNALKHITKLDEVPKEDFTLYAINFRYNAKPTPISREGWQYIRQTQVQSLGLPMMPLSREDVADLAQCSNLTSLQLEKTAITNEDLGTLTRLGQVTILHLSDTRVDGSGLTHLRAFRKLFALNLDGIPLKDNDLEQLQTLPLTTISLKNVPITDIGIQKLQAMPIITMDLESTRITDASVERLAKPSRLVKISLRSTPVSDLSLDSLDRCPNLHHVDVSNTKVTTDRVQRFAKAHPTCTILYLEQGRLKTIEGKATNASNGDQPSIPKAPVPPVLRFSMSDIDGKNVALSKYEGKVLLIVNVASQCGLTPQYQQLEALHEKYAGRGLALVGIPSNDFGGQEPDSNAKIREFCTKNYSVKFDLFSKVSVKGAGACDLYKFLTSKQTNPKFGGELTWNFEKFLVNRQGEVVARFAPVIKPDAPEVIKAIETELTKP